MKRRYNPLFAHEINNFWHHFRPNVDNGEDVIQVLKRNKGLRLFVILTLALALLLHILN